ncbi:MAG: AAA family ATPase [bacterium]|nr:AAA family ATPase [bacterium]
MSDIKKLFVAATRQNDGKTMTSLGLFSAMQKRFKSCTYMKPVGQQYVHVNNHRIDKDAVLFYNTFDCLKEDMLPHMSPIAVPHGFTENYIENPNPDELRARLDRANSALLPTHDFVLYEGTGHAGVGSVFDMCNADVAKQLGSKVILVSIGGIGKSIDEIMLNRSVFASKGVDLLGVIINKVLPEKYEKIDKVVRKGLERQGIPVLGVIPLNKDLTYPTVAGVADTLGADVIASKTGLCNSVEKFMTGDKTPLHALDKLTDHTLVIVPGDREGLIFTAFCENTIRGTDHHQVSGFVFTDGIRPHERIVELLRHHDIPMLFTSDESFVVMSKLNTRVFKIRSEDAGKIAIAEKLVEDYVDVDGIVAQL